MERRTTTLSKWPGSVLRDCRAALLFLALFSSVVNLLMLAGPLYMLQVYDRVLASGSVPTLVALSALLLGAYLFQGALDLVRSRVVVRLAELNDAHLGSALFRAVVLRAVKARPKEDPSQPIRDLDQLRTFLTSSGPLALADLPWTPIFLLFCWLIHPWLGAVALSGGLVLFGLTLVTEFATRASLKSVTQTSAARWAIVETTRRNAEATVAMGIGPALSERWSLANTHYLKASRRMSDIAGAASNISKVFRLMLQSALIGVGAYLVIQDQMLGGAMIAASVMTGRALAPLETAIANWRGFAGARASLGRLKPVLQALEAAEKPVTELPPARQKLEVTDLAITPPGAEKPVLSGLNFTVTAGTGLGIVGPSGSGKTSLLRALVGVWPTTAGTVRIDGAAIGQWSAETLGATVGYMGQSLELFSGTVAENIARMAVEVDDGAVVDAAMMAGVHEMILRLPEGYNTRVGEGGANLSAGQRQRVALARAVYGRPFLIVLDEPNANLDAEGDVALERAVRRMKQAGSIVVIVAHRPSAVAACEKILVVGNGTQQSFGDRDTLLRRLTPAPAAVGGPALKLVSDPATRTS